MRLCFESTGDAGINMGHIDFEGQASLGTTTSAIQIGQIVFNLYMEHSPRYLFHLSGFCARILTYSWLTVLGAPGRQIGANPFCKSALTCTNCLVVLKVEPPHRTRTGSSCSSAFISSGGCGVNATVAWKSTDVGRRQNPSVEEARKRFVYLERQGFMLELPDHL